MRRDGGDMRRDGGDCEVKGPLQGRDERGGVFVRRV